MRILALDVGEKTIGTAVSDPLGLTAQPLKTIRRRTSEEDVEVVASLVHEFKVEQLVVGLPLHLNGRVGPEAERVQEFGHFLAGRLGLPLYYWDERLTTVAAERVLLAADLSRRRRRETIDQTAACLILQGYLERQRRLDRPVDTSMNERIE